MVACSDTVIHRRGPRAAVWFALVLLAFAPAAPAESDDDPEPTSHGGIVPANAPSWTIITQNEYLDDSNGNTFNDPSVFVAYRQAHAQIWLGEFTTGAQIGSFIRDRRRSTYGFWYRFRDDFDHVVEANTEQILPDGFVLFAGARLIRAIPDDAVDRELVLPIVGFDKYYGNYNFFSLRVIRDPRGSEETSFVISNRFSTKTRYVTVGLVPRTDGDLGYFVQGKWGRWRAGIGRYDRFDFTDVDRTIFTVGVEIQR